MATKPTPKQVPAVPSGTSVVEWQQKLAQQAAEGAASEKADSEFVSFRGGILTFNGQEIPNNELDVIVLDSAYEPNTGARPCSVYRWWKCACHFG